MNNVIIFWTIYFCEYFYPPSHDKEQSGQEKR